MKRCDFFVLLRLVAAGMNGMSCPSGDEPTRKLSPLATIIFLTVVSYRAILSLAVINMKGKLTISRYHQDGAPMTIEVTDDLSGARFIEVSIEPAALMDAMTGRSMIPCEFVLTSKLVGKKREVKDEIVACGHPFGDKELLEAARKEVAKYEVDGWEARQGDIENSHNYVKRGIRVVFTRFVEPTK